MNEEELQKINKEIKEEKVENVIALYYLTYDEIIRRMEKEEEKEI